MTVYKCISCTGAPSSKFIGGRCYACAIATERDKSKMAWHSSTISSSGASVDASFSSMSSLASSGSSGSNGYQLESEVGREALREICCSALSRVLDFPDSHLETLLGFDEDEGQGGRGDDVTGMNVAR